MRTLTERLDVPVDTITVSAYEVPTDGPESDGTLEWSSTGLVLVEIEAGGQRGLGYSYADRAAAVLIRDTLADVLKGRDASRIPALWFAMVHALRNKGRPGLGMMAVSAVDAALWDLKGRLLDVPLATLLGEARSTVPVYGSGGFTSYSDRRLAEQLGDWAAMGLSWVKMKVGREPERDGHRVSLARDAIGSGTGLFVDANGACSRQQALRLAEEFAAQDVSWFEEPVSSDDLEGLRLLRDRSPAGMEISAGEYGWDTWYFRRMLEAQAVDVLQADATRCGGITGFLQVAALCLAHGMALSSHTAPALHLAACCAALPVRHMEWFYDHVRIERMLFDGVVEPVDGALRPDSARPGLGLEFKASDAERFAV